MNLKRQGISHGLDSNCMSGAVLYLTCIISFYIHNKSTTLWDGYDYSHQLKAQRDRSIGPRSQNDLMADLGWKPRSPSPIFWCLPPYHGFHSFIRLNLHIVPGRGWHLGGQPCPSGFLLAAVPWPDGPLGVTLWSCPFLKYTEKKFFLIGDKVQRVGLGAAALAGCQLWITH